MIPRATFAIMKITIFASRRDNGRLAFKAPEFGGFECYAPPGCDPAFRVNAGDKVDVRFYRPTDFVSHQPLPYFVADHIEKV